MGKWDTTTSDNSKMNKYADNAAREAGLNNKEKEEFKRYLENDKEYADYSDEKIKEINKEYKQLLELAKSFKNN